MRLSIMLGAAALGFATHAARAEEQLLFYNWTNYTSPEMITKFETETGIKVTLDTYDSNETLLAKLRAGSTGYDIAVASSDFVPILVKQDLLQKIDASAMPSYAHVAARWKDSPWDKGNAYSVPWQWGLTSAIVDTAIYKGPTDTLKVLFEPPPELAGKVSMFGSPSEVIGLALVYLGRPQCSSDPADLKAVDALLQKQKPAVKLYNSDGGIERMSSGETAAGQMWSGAALRARLDRSSLAYVFPKEGAVAWMDNIVVPKGAAHPENARKFVDFMMRPDNAALQSNFTGYQNGVDGSDGMLKPEYATAPEFRVPEGLKISFTPACPEAATRAYDRIWTRLRQ